MAQGYTSWVTISTLPPPPSPHACSLPSEADVTCCPLRVLPHIDLCSAHLPEVLCLVSSLLPQRPDSLRLTAQGWLASWSLGTSALHPTEGLFTSIHIPPHQPAGGQDFSRPSVSRTS